MANEVLTADPVPAVETTAAPSTTKVENTVQPNGTSTPPAPATTSAAPEATTPEKKEWDGNLETLKDLGADEVERAKSMRRYLTKKTQEISETKKKAEEYERLKSDPRFQQALTALNQPAGSQPQPVAAPPQQALWTESEWQEAQVNPSKMAELFDRGVQARVQEVAAQYAPLLQQIESKQKFAEKSQEIDEFAKMHPEVWDYYEAGILQPLVRDIVDSGQGSFADAFEKAEKIAKFYDGRATQKAQGRVIEKKAAVTIAPSPGNEPSIIWAADREEAKRLAFENAILGKKVTVRSRS